MTERAIYHGDLWIILGGGFESKNLIRLRGEQGTARRLPDGMWEFRPHAGRIVPENRQEWSVAVKDGRQIQLNPKERETLALMQAGTKYRVKECNLSFIDHR